VKQPETPGTEESAPSTLREALEHAERNCDNVVRFLSQKWPDTPDLCVQSEDIESTAYALQAVCEAIRPIVDQLESLGQLAQRLRARAAQDEKLAATQCSQPDSFMYVLGRAQTLKIVAEELEAVLGGTEPVKTKVEP